MTFNYRWEFKNYPLLNKGNVFSLFCCGGGSTMGYKLAGFNVLGGVEIEKKIADIYQLNHHPKFFYNQSVVDFKHRTDLPDALYQLDILDASPPCTSFSLAGVREKGWGKEKKFKEGNTKQILDTLFFDSIEIVDKLKPKIALFENVEGLLKGNAKKYFNRVMNELSDIGYTACYHLLDASTMGVPQQRKRVFIIAVRNDLLDKIPTNFQGIPELTFGFNYDKITYSQIADYNGKPITGVLAEWWKHREYGDSSMEQACLRVENKNKLWSQTYIYEDKVLPTLTTNKTGFQLYSKPIYLSEEEFRLASTFPLDYNFGNASPQYITGMSVPPVMIANIANEIYNQWKGLF